ncbi:MAG: hypothetical protein M5U12_19510 [Verrucomicrobia bacterium]|nr:hypothetical protein [Verrucomicrobiota bacterium]
MSLLAALTFSGSGWFWPATLAAALALAALTWSYLSTSSVPGRLRGLAAALKALGVALLAFCLLEPLWSGQRVRPGANLFVVLADNSQGSRSKTAANPAPAARSSPNSWSGAPAPGPSDSKPISRSAAFTSTPGCTPRTTSAN